VWGSLIAALALAASAAPALDVPYLPQSEDLCGGAAVAMVYRYWGEAHAGVQQFASLVDTRAGGIATDRLADAVAAHGWKVTRAIGSVDLLRSQLAARIPPIILLADRPHRYHYVVVVGISEDGVVVHDPAVGPSRRISTPTLLARWRPTNYWTMVIEPGGEREGSAEAGHDRESGGPAKAGHDRQGKGPAKAGHYRNTADAECDRLLQQAIDDVRGRGLDAADAAFSTVRRRCPSAPGVARELAGVRFAQRRWREAASLASDAVALDPHDAYAWNVLASSRFVQDDFTGSLDAWNHIGRPQIDLVRIEGVERMRYQLMAQAIGLTPNTVLTDDAFARAARRLAEMPDQTSSRISYRPAADGYAVVEVAVAERPPLPQGPVEWAATAARFLVEREADVAVPGSTGQGEVWEVSWRWWNNRPRVAVSFATPRVGWLPGVWRVEGSWEEQTYARSPDDSRIREQRTHAGLAISDWLTGNVRYELTGGVDSWNRNDRTISAGAGVQRRMFDDRLALFADASAWFGMGDGASFRGAGLRAMYNSAGAEEARWLVTSTAGVDAVSANAPFAVWPGAGDGHARPALLRAHPLLDDGVIVGPAFGRTLAYASVEAQRWLERGKLVRFGWAVFSDAARPWRGMDATAARTEVDAGVGLRIRIPGAGGLLRADFAGGLRDGAHAFSIGWQR